MSDTDDLSIPSSQAPHVSLNKTATEESFSLAGDVIHYTLVANNDGNVTLTNVTIVDPKLGALTCAQPATLAPGASLTCTGNYIASQPELDAGAVDNLATVTATRPSGPPLSDTADASVPAIQAPALTVTKTMTSVGPYDAVGAAISYSITVTNTGNVSLTGVTVTDPGVGAVLGTCAPANGATIAPGASVICVATHAVTQADIEAGEYTNTAIGTSDQAGPAEDDETVPVEQHPLLDVVKTATSPGPYDSVGDVITYSITASNIGNQNLTGVTITDPGAGVALGACAPAIPAALAPGASVVCAATHAVTQADLDTGSYTNVAFGDSGESDPAFDDETVTMTRSPDLDVVKSVTSTGPYNSVGDEIAYSITVTNTGNVTLTGVTVTDPSVGAVLGSCTQPTPAELAPLDSLTCVATHAVTQADIDAGQYTNVAVGDSNETPADTDGETVPITQTPAVKVLKTETSVRPYQSVGQIVSYSITVTNTGNQTLTGVTVADPGVGAVLGPCTPAIPATIAPGETIACTATHSVTQADLDAGGYSNTAFGDSDQTLPNSDVANVPMLPNPALTVTKVGSVVMSVVPPADRADVGDRIDYTITAANSGNVTLTGVTVSDPLLALLSCTPAQPAVLTPGESIACTGSYTITQVDLDAGKVDNTATVDSDQTEPAGTPNTVPLVQATSMTVEKSSGTTSLAAPATVTYSYLVTNTGNLTLTDISLADDNDNDDLACPATSLASGAMMTCSATHTFTQTELDANGSPVAGSGSLANTVTASSTGGTHATDRLSIPIVQRLALTLVKTALPTTYTGPGQPIGYSYLVTNSGNTTIVGPLTVTDDRVTVTCPAGDLPVGDSLTCTATYTTTQADVDVGSITNTAFAHGSFGASEVTSNTDSETVTATKAPALTIVKSSTTTTVTTVGQVVPYTYLVTDTGNVTLTGLALADDKTDASPVCTATTLSPTKTTTCSAVHTVTQAELDAGGSLSNTVTATTTQGASGTDTLDIPIVQSPALTIDKTSPDTSFTTPGDVLHYSYLVTNSGNVTLAGPFTVSDDLATDEACPVTASLAPGASITCSASYTITQADIDSGHVTNVASATNGTVTSPTDTIVIPPTQGPALTIAKSSTTTTVTTAGVVPYSYLVTNTGNVTLTGLALADTNTDASPFCPDTALAPGASTTCSAVHTVTQAELDAGGSLANTVSATTTQGASGSASLAIPIVQGPALTIVKSITAGDPYDAVGDTISYSYTVTNTGNVTISAIAVSDDNTDAPPVCAATTLAPTQSTTCTATRTVTQADLDTGSITNVAGATGTPAGGVLVPPTDTETAGAAQSPALTVEKTILSGNPYTTAGAKISYSYTVTNTGNVTITGLVLSDDKTDASPVCLATTLAPTQTTTCTAVHTVTQADLDAGSVTNHASVTGTPAGGTLTPPTDQATANATQSPALTIDKTSPTTTVMATGPVSYTYLVTNTGNVTLTGLALADTNTDVVPSCPATTLAPSASTTCTAVHTVTQAELDAGGSLANTVTATTAQGATGTDSLAIPIAQTPALILDKEISGRDVYTAAGQTIGYLYVVTNTGNVTITGIAVGDDKTDRPPCFFATPLGPGQSRSCTAVYTVTQADLDAGSLTNHATATGTPAGGILVPPTATATARGVQAPGITVDKISTATQVTKVGQEIPYQYTVTNTGNITITGLALADNNTDAAPTCPATTLAPGASTTCTAVHTVTQADLDAGGTLDNTVTATTGQGATGGDTLSIPVTQAPGLTITKATTATAFGAVGQSIDYTITLTNTGNVTLTAVTVTDPGATLTCAPAQPATLPPGATMTCTGIHVITGADVTAGSYTNTASGVGDYGETTISTVSNAVVIKFEAVNPPPTDAIVQAIGAGAGTIGGGIALVLVALAVLFVIPAGRLGGRDEK